MDITAKSTVGDLAAKLDPAFQVRPESAGALRLLEALSTKSETAKAAVNALSAAATKALAELGLDAASTEGAGNPTIFAQFVAPAPVAAAKSGDAAPAAVAPAPADEDKVGEVLEAVKAVRGEVAAVATKFDQMDARVSTLEKARGVSHARGWENEAQPTQQPAAKGKSGMWANSAFDIVNA